MKQDRQHWWQWMVCGTIIAAIFLCYGSMLRAGFINFDDGIYVEKNARVQEGLTPGAVQWAFTTGHASNWHPVTWLSHMLDCQLFGLDAGKHHLINLVFHALNSVLLFLLLRKLTGAMWRSAMVAALFALHPLHVESVAWVAERKDLLSACFGMLTLLAYTRFVTESKAQSPRSKVWYAVMLILFALGLMSKPMLVTWPFVMLLLDFWPLHRLPADSQLLSFKTWKSHRALLIEKIPLLALVVASCVITYWVQSHGGAVASLERIPFGDRIMTAIIAYAAYLLNMCWPADLTVLYLPPARWEEELVGLALVVVIGMTLVAFRAGRKRGYLATGWFWYLGTLVPVIGLVQVGNQYMADRYTYLPLIGIFILMVWGVWELLCQHKHARPVAALVGCSLVATCGVITWKQAGYWKNSETLFTHCLRVDDKNYVIHNHLGTALLFAKRFEEAEAQYREALRISPVYSDAMNNLGVLLTQQGRIEEAMRYLQAAVRISPHFADTYGKLAIALSAAGKCDEAINYYHQALQLKPDLVEALNNLAWIFATHPEEEYRNGPEAVQLAEKACQLSGRTETIYIGTLGAAYAEAGRFPDAIATAEQAVKSAKAHGDEPLAKKNTELLELYRQGQPYREKPPRLEE